MPKFVVPRNTGTHRVAAIALYRALLTSCAAVPVAAEERQPLRNIVRNKFRNNKLVHSSRLLTLAFIAGYDTLDLFDRAAGGDATSIQHISELLSQTPAHLKRPPRLPRLPRKLEGRQPSACSPPEQQLLLTRPYVTVPGKRKIPILRVNNGTPFLMYGKPQAPSLGRIIRWKVEQGQMSLNWTATLEHDMLPLAQKEDFWDDLLEAAFGVSDCNDPEAHEAEGEGDDVDESRWAKEPEALHSRLNIEYLQRKAARVKTGRLMQGIVDREEVLAKKEKEEKKHMKRQSRAEW